MIRFSFEGNPILLLTLTIEFDSMLPVRNTLPFTPDLCVAIARRYFETMGVKDSRYL